MIFGCSGMTWEAGAVHLLGRTADRAGESAEHSVMAVGRGVKCPRKLTGEERIAAGCLAYAGLTIDAAKYLDIPNAEKIWIDGINERGLMIALLNYPADSKRNKDVNHADSIHPARIVPHILSRCETVEMAASVLERSTTDDSELPMQAHFLIYDSCGESVVAEPSQNSFKIYRHTEGVLTNAPALPKHMENWHKFCMNPTMLPAAFSSTARFLRLMQIKSRADKAGSEEEAVSKMFDNLAPVTVPAGLDERKKYRTMFTTVMSAESKTYYITSSENHRIKAVKVGDLHDGETKEWSMDEHEDINWLK